MNIFTLGYQASAQQSVVDLVGDISNSIDGGIFIAASFGVLIIGGFIAGALYWSSPYAVTSAGQTLSSIGGHVVIVLGIGIIGYWSVDLATAPKTEDLRAAIQSELSERYQVQTVEMRQGPKDGETVETAEAVNNLHLRSWVQKFTDESLEPAHTLVRLDDDRTASYELRLATGDVELLMLDDDSSTPHPEELER